MGRKNRIISAIAVGAVAALMVSSTVYQARADDISVPASNTGTANATDTAGTGDVGNDTGDDDAAGTDASGGYAGEESEKVRNLNIRSLGVFNYDAGEAGKNILLSSKDMEDLADATKALSDQLLSLGKVAKAEDKLAAITTELKFKEVGNKIDANAAGGTQALNDYKAEVNGRFSNVDQTITSNVETINQTITNNITTVNSTIAANKTEAENYTNGKIGEVNETISGNKALADQRMDDLEGKITENATSGTSAVTNLREDVETGLLDTVVYKYENISGNPTVTFSPNPNQRPNHSSSSDSSGSSSGEP